MKNILVLIFSCLLAFTWVSCDANKKATYEKGMAHIKNKEFAEGVACLTEAAEAGYAEAQFELAEEYRYGNEALKSDRVAAAKWYIKAAEQGHADAQYMAGFCYQKGLGVTEDTKKAIEWYTEAGEQNHESALDALAFIYYTGEGGIEINDKKAIELWTKAVEFGSYNAKFFLDEIKEKGAVEYLRPELFKKN
jgi:TPR repeat protein